LLSGQAMTNRCTAHCHQCVVMTSIRCLGPHLGT
jgi:hypothetical protein